MCIWPAGVKGHLHFVEDQLVPDAVSADHALRDLTVLPVYRQVQQPLLQGGLGSALDLVGSAGGREGVEICSVGGGVWGRGFSPCRRCG